MKRQIAQGALWTLLEVGGAEGLNLLAFIILSRLLRPEDYGVASLAGLTSALLQIPLTNGLVDAVVARPDLDDDALSTAFWANVGLAAVLFGLAQAAAGPVAWCFGQPLIAPMLRWFSLCFFTTALTFIPLAVLRRNLDLRAYAVRAVIGAASGGAIGIGMALAGCGIWSLVGSQIAQGLAAVATVWLMSGWRPRPRISVAALRSLAPFSAHRVSGAVLDFLANRIDVVAVGLFLNTTSLGYYYLLKRVLQTASSTTLYPCQTIMMPALRHFSGDQDRFNQAYVSIVTVAQAGWVLIAVGMLTSSPEVVPAVFGARWAGAAPLFQTASLIGLSFAITSLTSPALGAAGSPRAYVPLAILKVVLTAAFLGSAALWGVVATGAGLGLSSLLLLPVHLLVLRRRTGLDPRQLLRPCLRITVAGAIAAALVSVARIAVLQAHPLLPLALLAALGAFFCAAVYLAAFWFLAHDTFGEITSVLRSALYWPRSSKSVRPASP
jgi:O-antigen/teichoic acid export membrane protein